MKKNSTFSSNEELFPYSDGTEEAKVLRKLSIEDGAIILQNDTRVYKVAVEMNRKHDEILKLSKEFDNHGLPEYLTEKDRKVMAKIKVENPQLFIELKDNIIFGETQISFKLKNGKEIHMDRQDYGRKQLLQAISEGKEIGKRLPTSEEWKLIHKLFGYEIDYFIDLVGISAGIYWAGDYVLGRSASNGCTDVHFIMMDQGYIQVGSTPENEYGVKYISE